MEIEWENSRPLAPVIEVDEFENEHFVRFTREQRRFLTTTTNGGGPVGDVLIPTENCPGGPGGLLAVYGLNHLEMCFDMGRDLTRNAMFLQHLVPFGYDQGSSEVFIDVMDQVGRVVFIPLQEVHQPSPQIYHVANSIAEFLEESARLALEFLQEDS